MPWLAIRAGALYDSAGQALRLFGLHDVAASPAAALPGPFSAVPEGRRVVVVHLSSVADLKPAALQQLDRAIAERAQAGIYTLLSLSARLWMSGRHALLGSRHVSNPAVLFALAGRKDLAARLAKGLLQLREVHPNACVWLPLESASSVFALLPDPRVGLLWDAARPQAPRPSVLTAGLRAPLLLDGWWPSALHPLADERLMRLCRQGCVGWLARQPSTPMSVRTEQALQRAIALSLQDDPLRDPRAEMPLAA